VPAGPIPICLWDAPLPDPLILIASGSDPEESAVRSDAVGLALLVVLGTLTPAERIAFVLHDLFGVPFDIMQDVCVHRRRELRFPLRVVGDRFQPHRLLETWRPRGRDDRCGQRRDQCRFDGR
jgi:hypothetical protein